MGSFAQSRITGKERDSETGLDYFGARYYASNMGRWMSPDWSGTPEAVPYVDMSDPQTLNLYSYVRNNPLGHADADGHCCDAEWNFFKQELRGVWDTTGGGLVEAGRQFANGQAAANVRETYFSGNVGGKLVSAGSEFVSQTKNMVVSAANGDPRAIGQVAGVVITAKAASELKGGNSAEPTAPKVPQPASEGQTMVGPSGTAVRIPAGQVAEPTANGNGIIYREPGTTGNANTTRIMGPDAQGRYPDGYVRTYNGQGQPVNPSTAKPDVPAKTHTPL